MKKLLFASLICLSITALPVQALDITLTFTAGQLTTFATALGEQKGYMDNQTPPQLRAATLPEVKQFFLERARQVVIDSKAVARLYKDAAATVVVPAFNPTAP